MFFFFKQKTAYEMRISDWSSDVCSSDLYYYQRIDTQGTEGHGPASSRWTINPSNPLSNDPSVLSGLTAINTQYLKNTSAALFGQLSWKVTDQLTIQPGVRLNYDKKDGYYRRSEEHTSELQSLMRISYAVFCLKKKTENYHMNTKMQAKTRQQ